MRATTKELAARMRVALVAAGMDRERVGGATDEEVIEIAQQVTDAIRRVFDEFGAAVRRTLNDMAYRLGPILDRIDAGDREAK